MSEALAAAATFPLEWPRPESERGRPDANWEAEFERHVGPLLHGSKMGEVGVLRRTVWHRPEWKDCRPSPIDALLAICDIFLGTHDGDIVYEPGDDLTPAGRRVGLFRASEADWFDAVFRIRRRVPESLLVLAFHARAMALGQAPTVPATFRVGLPGFKHAFSIAAREGVGDYHVHRGAAYTFEWFGRRATPYDETPRSRNDRLTRFLLTLHADSDQTEGGDALLALLFAHGVASWASFVSFLSAAKKISRASLGTLCPYIVDLENSRSLLEKIELERDQISNEVKEFTKRAKKFESEAETRLHIDETSRRISCQISTFWRNEINLDGSPSEDLPDASAVLAESNKYGEKSEGLLLSMLSFFIAQSSEKATDCAALGFWLDFWIRARCQLYSSLTQPPGMPGLDHFKSWYNRMRFLEDIVGKNDLADQVASVAGHKRVKELELRYSLDFDPSGIYSQAKNIVYQYGAWRKWRVADDQVSPSSLSGLDLCFTASLIKGGVKLGDDRIGEYLATGERYAAQVNRLASRLDEDPRYRHLIRGLDCCNLERVVPNFIVAAAYSRLRSLNKAAQTIGFPDLKFTIHAGEDFSWPGQGLRFIDECLSVLRMGDRMGHGFALGLDFDIWFDSLTKVGPKTTIGEWIDDLAWALGLLRGATGESLRSLQVTEPDLYSAIRSVENCLSAALVGMERTTKSASSIYGTKCLNYWARSNPTTVERCYSSFYSREGMERTLSWFDEGVDRVLARYLERDALQRDDETLALECVLFGNFIRDQKNDTVLISIRSDVIKLKSVFLLLQKIVRRKVSMSGIVIESCPSSNMTTSGIKLDFALHPIFALSPISDKSPDGREAIAVSVNSDDPLTFAADVVHEYMYLWATALRILRSEGTGSADYLAREWIRRLSENGHDSRFHEDRLESESKILELWRDIS